MWAAASGATATTSVLSLFMWCRRLVRPALPCLSIPAVGLSSPKITRMVVVFPAPLGPRNPVTRPFLPATFPAPIARNDRGAHSASGAICCVRCSW